MKWSKSMGCLVALLGAVASCTSSTYHKETILPERPMVYPMSVKLMDVNWVDQEIARIPLLIEETREGNLITKVRVEPTGDIRFPGMGKCDDHAFRWTVESCNATRVDAPYTLSLKLTYQVYPGIAVHSEHKGEVTTTTQFSVYGNESHARVLVHRSADGLFSMELKNDCISGPQDGKPEDFILNPGFYQQPLDLQLKIGE